MLNFLRSLDPKLIATIVTTAITRLAFEVGIPGDDPLLQSAVALAAGAVAGWLWPNEGTLLREEEIEDGNAIVPEGERA